MTEISYSSRDWEVEVQDRGTSTFGVEFRPVTWLIPGNFQPCPYMVERVKVVSLGPYNAASIHKGSALMT